MQLITKLFFVAMMVLLPTLALAYVGPGLGAGAIGVILGIVGSIFLALFALFWYPFKRLLKKLRKTDQHDPDKH